MTSLVTAYQKNDIAEFETILLDQKHAIMDDAFIREHIVDLLRNIRTEVLIKLIRPYTRIRLDFISQQLKLDISEVESLLVACILDGTIPGRIDQAQRILLINPAEQTSLETRYVSLDKLANKLKDLQASIVGKSTVSGP